MFPTEILLNDRCIFNFIFIWHKYNKLNCLKNKITTKRWCFNLILRTVDDILQCKSTVQPEDLVQVYPSLVYMAYEFVKEKNNKWN